MLSPARISDNSTKRCCKRCCRTCLLCCPCITNTIPVLQDCCSSLILIPSQAIILYRSMIEKERNLQTFEVRHERGWFTTQDSCCVQFNIFEVDEKQVGEITRIEREDCNDFDLYTSICFYVMLLMGAFFTLLTRLLQDSPFYWHHSATVGLSFGIFLGIFLMFHFCCIYLVRPSKIIIWGVIKKFFSNTCIVFIFCGIFLLLGAFFNWIWWDLKFETDDPNFFDNGNYEAKKWTILGAAGFGMFYVIYFAIWILFAIYRMIIYTPYQKCKRSYEMVKSEEIPTISDIQFLTRLPPPIVSIIYSYNTFF